MQNTLEKPNLSKSDVERIVRDIILAGHDGLPSQADREHSNGAPKLVVSISARHCHLTDQHVEKLFGRKKLRPKKFSAEKIFDRKNFRLKKISAEKIFG